MMRKIVNNANSRSNHLLRSNYSIIGLRLCNNVSLSYNRDYISRASIEDYGYGHSYGWTQYLGGSL